MCVFTYVLSKELGGNLISRMMMMLQIFSVMCDVLYMHSMLILNRKYYLTRHASTTES